MVALQLLVERVWSGKQCVFVDVQYTVHLMIKSDINRLRAVLCVCLFWLLDLF
jgi:hypothetical protein